MRVITTDVTVPSLARFTFWAPTFCETKVVEAMAILWMKSMMNASSLL